MTTANKRGWGDPRLPSFEADIRAQCVLVTAGGIRVRLHKHVADIFRYLNTGLARHYNLAGYADDWGLAIRPIRGYEKQWAATHDPRWLSNHSYGLAEDLDSSVNPMTSDLKAEHEFIRAIIAPFLAPFGGRLVWGGEYSGARKDYMHFEYIGTPEQAAADSLLARHLLEEALTAAHKPTTIEGDPDMMLILKSPSHSYARLPGWVGVSPEMLAIYKKRGVTIENVTDDVWMAAMHAEKQATGLEKPPAPVKAVAK